MPLIIISGIPCSGKSAIAKRIFDHMQSSGRKVQMFTDESLHINKNQAYSTATQEKMV
jgi:tRNA uridine 5-carbamoylmethylation protein Kti12